MAGPMRKWLALPPAVVGDVFIITPCGCVVALGHEQRRVCP
jgi:hypothetical protein